MGFSAVNYNTMSYAQTKVAGSVLQRKLKTFLSWYLPGLKLNKYEYSRIVENMGHPTDKNENCYPTIIPGYDRSPRAGRAAVIFYDNNLNLL